MQLNFRCILSSETFLVTETPEKITKKKAFYFTLIVLFVPEIFKFLFTISGHVGKRLDKKAIVNFKMYDVTNWITSDYNTHVARYLRSHQTMRQ